MYDVHIQHAFVADLKAAIIHGGGLGVFFFIIYSAYALCKLHFHVVLAFFDTCPNMTLNFHSVLLRNDSHFGGQRCVAPKTISMERD